MTLLPYRAVIADLDRTLLRSDKSISPYTRRVLLEWEARGAFLYAATARPERTITEYRRRIPFRSAVTLNGARIITPAGVRENTMRPESAACLLEQLLEEGGALVSVETGNGLFANRKIPEWGPKVLADLRGLPGTEKIYKILVSWPEAAPGRTRIAAPEDVYSTVADGKLIQYMARSATKWNGILQVLREDGIPPEEAVCFGDDNDDIEPILRCGRGVAVGNALEEVKRAADDVAGSNDEDGVAAYLEKLLRHPE